MALDHSKNLWSPLSSFGGVLVNIALTLLHCGFIPSMVRIYSDILFLEQNFDFKVLSF